MGLLFGPSEVRPTKIVPVDFTAPALTGRELFAKLSCASRIPVIPAEA